MDILFVTPSLLPYPVESGPAEACAALAKALRSLGHRVTLLAPFPEEPEPTHHSMSRRLDPLTFELSGRNEQVAVFDGRSSAGVEWILFQHAALAELFDEGPQGLYAQAVLARAAAELFGRERSFDAIHFHGEETALACAVAALEKRLTTVFSVYSLSRPLCFDTREAKRLGFDALLGEDGTLCPVRSAIACARRVTTSVPERALSATPGESEAMLSAALKARAQDLTAVLGGLDASVWNPVTDAHLAARYTHVELSGKLRSKAMLQNELKLDVDPDVCLIGAVEGAVGAERIERVVQELVRTDVQLAVQVLDEDAESIDHLIALSERMPHRLQVRIGDSQLRTHRIIAGSDALLVASDRPVLSMAAQRYGTLPVARRGAVAGETIVDIDAKLATGTGILVDDRSVEALLAGARRAIAAYNRGLPFERLRARLMRLDHSWEKAARALEHVYLQAADIQAA
jgi:starch synthase